MRWRCFLLLLATGLVGISGPRAALGDKAGPDTRAADEQIVKSAGIGLTDEDLLEFFRKRTLSDADRDRMKTLIQQLGDDSYEVREKASRDLVALGTAAEGVLNMALKSPDLEVAHRAEECLRQIKRGVGGAISAAAARLLAVRKPREAAGVLLAYLPFADNETVADDVRTALTAVAVRDGKPDAVVLAALTDKVSVRRAAAAEALCRAGAVQTQPAIRKLLQDPELPVRLQVALALTSAGEKDAIPVLIDLLGQLPYDQALRAEDMLLRVADEQAPGLSLGRDDSSREKCRLAWVAWWKTESPKLDLARLNGAPTWHGYTLLLLLDQGRALELDKQDKVRWQIDGLQFPLDVQRLPGNRVLVAEHHANRVTVRNPKGEIIWEKPVEAPLVAQRLPNGNTFIATNSQLLEVTPTGKEIFTYNPPGDEYIMKAQKLSNGEIACVLSHSRFVRLDPTGKELSSFPVQVRTSGGRIQVLPNGHVLVPEHNSNRLVEYDAAGKPVWEVTIQQPIAAVRLPNGHTLVTSMSQNRAIELDSKGTEVWEYKSDTRVSRAFRR
jgi:HEAT repeat protein